MKQTFVKAAIMASFMAAVSCGQAPTEQGPAQYGVMTIATTNREIPTNKSATIRGRQDIQIYPQVSGTISELRVAEGESVSKGQTLFIIDQGPYKAALQTAEANVAAAKASVATAQLTYDSKKELFAKNVVSQYDLSTAENTLLTAKAQLAQAEAQRVNAANNLSYTVVKAPSNGTVGQLPYRVGSLVSASIPQPLTTVSDNSEMYVYFSMSGNELLSLTRKYGSIANTLKNMPDETMLRIYDLQLVEQGNRIHALRREFTQRLQPVVADYYRTLSGDREQVELHYKSELNDRPFDELLLAARQKDLANEFTTAGIHRDDLVLKIGGYPLRKYGSQGQQKSFLIALKLAQYTIVAREKGEKPILLLDDLFDKLDAGRVEQLIRLVSEDSFGQILITDCNPTRLRTILDKAGGEYALFTVGNGAVTQGNATATAAAADPDKGSAGSRPGNAVTDGAAEPMEEKTPGQTGTAAADRTEGQAGESPAGEPARRPSEPVPAPEPAEEPAAEPDGNGARPGDAASEGGRP